MRTVTWILASAFLLAGPLVGEEDPATAHKDAEHGQEKKEEPKPEAGEVKLTPRALQTAELEIQAAAPAVLRLGISLPGEITLNEDRLAHVTPRSSGVVKEVLKALGDKVQEGEPLAVLESPELAEAVSAHLTAARQLEIAKAGLKREEEMLEKGASSGKEVFEAKRILAEAENADTTTQQRLRALGLGEEEVHQVKGTGKEPFARITLKAPLSGTIVGRHMTVGEAVHADSEVFLVADLGSVWANIAVYPQDLPKVKPGLSLLVSSEADPKGVEAKVAYLVPLVNERTRAAVARSVLPNPDGKWRPGMFVTVRLVLEEAKAAVAVPDEALIDIAGRKTVFVEKGEGVFHATQVKIGRSDGQTTEILEGLAPGDKVVVRNVFILKAELGKGEAKDED